MADSDAQPSSSPATGSGSGAVSPPPPVGSASGAQSSASPSPPAGEEKKGLQAATKARLVAALLFAASIAFFLLAFTWGSSKAESTSLQVKANIDQVATVQPGQREAVRDNLKQGFDEYRNAERVLSGYALIAAAVLSYAGTGTLLVAGFLGRRNAQS